MKTLLFGLLALQLVVTGDISGMEQKPSKEQKLPELQLCMKSLIDRFGPSKTEGGIVEVDISYPSFLTFFYKKMFRLIKRREILSCNL